jgi:hypothetical protein
MDFMQHKLTERYWEIVLSSPSIEEKGCDLPFPFKYNLPCKDKCMIATQLWEVIE